MESCGKRAPSAVRGTMIGLAILFTICFAASSSFADVKISDPPAFPDISVLSQYSIVSVGPSASIMMNSGPAEGKVLVGDGSVVTSSGGDNGAIPAGVDQSGALGAGSDTPTPFINLQTPPTVTMVAPSVGTDAFNEAAALASFGTGLMPTQTFSSLPNATITGNGGLNVIDITGNSDNPSTTLMGTANDFFVIQLSGTLSENKTITLNGVDPSHVLWVFTAAAGTGNVFSTSGGGTEVGTYLATGTNQNFQFSNLNLTGALWNTGGHIQFVSGSKIVAASPFMSPTVIPEPSTLSMVGAGGLIALFGIVRRKQRSRN